MIFAFEFFVSVFFYPIGCNEEWSLSSLELSYITLLLRASRFVFRIVKASYMKNVQYLSYTSNNKVVDLDVYSYNCCKQNSLQKHLCTSEHLFNFLLSSKLQCLLKSFNSCSHIIFLVLIVMTPLHYRIMSKFRRI